jgi:hypothetical protein
MRTPCACPDYIKVGVTGRHKLARSANALPARIGVPNTVCHRRVAHCHRRVRWRTGCVGCRVRRRFAAGGLSLICAQNTVSNRRVSLIVVVNRLRQLPTTAHVSSRKPVAQKRRLAREYPFVIGGVSSIDADWHAPHAMLAGIGARKETPLIWRKHIHGRRSERTSIESTLRPAVKISWVVIA